MFAGVKACIEAKKPLVEEPYEVSLDNHGCRDGPRTGRLRASGNVRPDVLPWKKNTSLYIYPFFFTFSRTR